MGDKLNEVRNEQLNDLKDALTFTIFEKLEEVEELTLISPKIAADFKESSDFTKIHQIIQQYLLKYRKDLSCFKDNQVSLGTLKEMLGKNILTLYRAVED